MKFSKAEIEAVIEASPRTTVPFNKLILSDTYQARLAGSTSKMSITELAASIKESNVLQNLIVVKGVRGLFEVWITIAGIYFVLCFSCSLGFDVINRRLAAGSGR